MHVCNRLILMQSPDMGVDSENRNDTTTEKAQVCPQAVQNKENVMIGRQKMNQSDTVPLTGRLGSQFKFSRWLGMMIIFNEFHLASVRQA